MLYIQSTLEKQKFKEIIKSLKFKFGDILLTLYPRLSNSWKCLKRWVISKMDNVTVTSPTGLWHLKLNCFGGVNSTDSIETFV